MIAYVEGKLTEKRPGELVVEAGGVGFQLVCSANTVAAAPQVGTAARVYTLLSVREDAMELFGFSTREERAMFQKLCTVSGIGPRSALAVLSSLSLRDLQAALITGDAAALARAPGVGKKTSQRLILELRDKVEADLPAGLAPLGDTPNDPAREAVAALVSLGYSNSEAQRAVSAVHGQADKSEALVLLALKRMDQ